MSKGYMGEIVKINLSNKKVEKIILKKEVLKKFIGGSGLGAKFLFELTGPGTDPLGEENVLIFMTGPLTGTKAFSSDRFSVITKSPLTGIYTESDCGGRWGSMLKKSGYDGIIIEGISEKPVYIWINDKEVKIIDASGVWGLDTFDTYKKLKELTTPKAEVACIGPAGEKLVRYAAIMTEGVSARAAARSGVGTVMGSKKLKAIVVSGNQSFEIHNQEGFEKFYKEHSKAMVSETKVLGEFGTSCGVESNEKIGALPIKNWGERRFFDAGKISGQYMAKEILKKRYFCGKCLIGCGREIEVMEGKYKTDGITAGPEYETVSMMGSNLFINDIRAVAKTNELCNRYGLDTVSTGSVIAMTMECYEHELIDKNWLDGVDLKWGNEDAVIEMIHKIGKREGIGKLLGEGTVRIAKEIGSYAIEFAIQVKGLETTALDPRAKTGIALGYATSNRGGAHNESFCHDFQEGAVLPDLGYPETVDRLDPKGAPQFVVKFQHFMSMFDALHTCKFTVFGGMTLKPLVEMLELITGFGLNEREYLKTGERMFNLKRLYNIKCGVSRKDDTLPPRYLTQKRGIGEYEDQLPPLGMLLDEYYKLRGWSEIGIPVAEKIKELELSEFV